MFFIIQFNLFIRQNQRINKLMIAWIIHRTEGTLHKTLHQNTINPKSAETSYILTKIKCQSLNIFRVIYAVHDIPKCSSLIKWDLRQNFHLQNL